jgi:hypothetical protein
MQRTSIIGFRFTVILLAAALGCSGGGSGEPEGPEVTATGPLSLAEADMAAQVDGDGLLVGVVLRNDGKGRIEGTIRLILEDLDGTFTREGRQTFTLDPGTSVIPVALSSIPDLSLPDAQAVHVLRYRVETNVGTLRGIRSVFPTMSRDQVVLFGPNTFYEGESTRLKVFTRDPVSGKVLPNRAVIVRASVDDTVRETTVTTDESGAATAELRLEREGSLVLQARMATDSGADAVAEKSGRVERVLRVLVTTDKPLYQPGQEIHIRVLALKKPRLNPDAGSDCILEVLDGKGNKVFKQRTTTSDFGVAFTRFRLATEVNMGTYKVRATVGETVTEKAVTVERYSLPKFRVDMALEKPFYQVGQEVKGTVAARYFFGKPVAGGSVNVTLYAFDVDFTPFATLQGVTGADGVWSFATTLPPYLVGQPLEQGKALIRVVTEVMDTAGQKVAKESGLTVAQNPIEVVLIPESGTIVPGLENLFHVFVEDPAGSPVAADVRVTPSGGAPIDVATDASGLGSFALTPTDNSMTMEVQAVDARGNAVTRTFQFLAGVSGEAVLVRTDKALYRVGETAVVTVFAPDARDRIYLDVLRQGQVVREEAFDLNAGQGTVEVDLDGEMTGDLVFSAYYMAANGTIVRDEKLTFVQGADALTVEVTTDKTLYAPGQPAKVDFKVTRLDGTPAVAALGIQVVDEAVYALSENKPGLLRTYFELEEAIRQPRYEVHGAGFDLTTIVTDSSDDPAERSRRNREAQAAFSALGDIGTATASSSWEQALNLAREALNPFFTRERERIVKNINDRFAEGSLDYEAVRSFLVDQAVYFDFFGNAYKFRTSDGWTYTMLSFGPDEIEGTADDWSTTLQDWEFHDRGWMEDGNGMGGGPGGFADAAASSDAGPVPEPNAEGEGPRVRKDFPETLYVNPLFLTNEQGEARVEFNMADSITEWRLSGLANSADGRLGSANKGMTVFMDFFVDLDLPRTLTRGDEVSFPIAVYNYLDKPQTVNLDTEVGDWAELLSGARTSVTLGPGEVIGVNVGLRARSVGWHGVTVRATGDAGAQDAVMRLVEVMPDGVEVRDSVSGKLDGYASREVVFPEPAIPGTPSIRVKVYPGVMAQAVEGLDSLLQMPSGCFEQTTATLWPNALVLDYLQESGQINPAIELKAREFISLGYQRLLVYECTGGGFTWFGDPAPANLILSAMGVMEFADIAKVMEIDEAIIPRTMAFLGTKQKSDGSWHEDQGSEFATVRYDDLMTTCFITWALASANGDAGKALGYIGTNLDDKVSTYALALCANALASAAPADSRTRQVLDALVDRVKQDGDDVYWDAETADSGDYWYGGEGGTKIEATSLAVLALLEAGRAPDLVGSALGFLAKNKDSFGNWGSTHATILALKAFVKSLTALTQQAAGVVTVTINGSAEPPLVVNADNQDVFFQFELNEYVDPFGPNLVEVDFVGDGTLMYQIVWTYWVPGSPGTPPGGPIEIDVEYDKSDLAVNDTVNVTARVTNVSSEPLPMVMVDLGIPPGFDVISEGLEEAVREQIIQKFETTARQILVYVDVLPGDSTLELAWQLRAKYPLKVQCPDSSTYLYYDTGTRASSSCAPLTVE